MRWAAGFLFVLLLADPPEPAIPYFTNVREVSIAHPDHQNFFIVDAELWAHSRSDLGDLRLYAESNPVQYALSEQRAGTSSEETEAKILNLGSVAGHTEFDLDTQALPEYDHIRLRLDAHDFVIKASVWGGDAPREARVELPSSTLYDFTKEQLGSNSILKLPASSFRYLHVQLAQGIAPQQVKGASISNLREQKASWTRAGECGTPKQEGRKTEIVCRIAPRVPLNRLFFRIDTKQVNFRRYVTLEDAKHQQLAGGEISRVRVNRAGTLVNNEQLALDPSLIDADTSSIAVVVENGDNPSLAITAVEPLSLERRVYFDPQGKRVLKLYYGDEKLAAPVYDYARFFHVDESAAEAKLGPGEHNPQYTGRPDDRPWSERHPTLLWTAMIVAVLALMAIALRGLRAQARSR